MPLTADGGIMTRRDVVRYLANNADFVLAGRAFMYAVAALGKDGSRHIMDMISEEFRIVLA